MKKSIYSHVTSINADNKSDNINYNSPKHNLHKMFFHNEKGENPT
jgi:hypothetical protein